MTPWLQPWPKVADIYARLLAEMRKLEARAREMRG